jgi:putative NADH-flavin reductase
MLIYRATGKAGRLPMERALERGWTVAAFVRNPDKVPEAAVARGSGAGWVADEGPGHLPG